MAAKFFPLTMSCHALPCFLGSLEYVLNFPIFAFPLEADAIAITECELILYRAAVPFGGNEDDLITLTVCPRHRAK